jgi:hypothetical protein
MWLKLAKIGKNRIFDILTVNLFCLGCVPRPEKCENSRKSSKLGQFLPILATFYQLD